LIFDEKNFLLIEEILNNKQQIILNNFPYFTAAVHFSPLLLMVKK